MGTVQSSATDVVNAILGVDDDSRIVQLRNQKPELADQLQAYYDAIFAPTAASAAELALTDRYLIAIRVAAHTGSEAVMQWYAAKALGEGVSSASIERAGNVSSPWSEQTPLAAAIRHADLVTVSPSQTSEENLQQLKHAGLSPAGILSLAQVIAFVSYQLRLIAGLRAFGDRR
ncbi:MAG: CMD domain-containing protein [Thermomicrobiales bacterium]